MLFWLNPILNFAVPFAVLPSARAKRHVPMLLQVALILLLGRWLDAYLLVVPALGPAPGWPVFAVTASLAVLAAIRLTWLRLLAGESTTGFTEAREAS